jgi:hypothetical protein
MAIPGDRVSAALEDATGRDLDLREVGAGSHIELHR